MITTLENQKQSAQVAVADDPRWARIFARDRAADGQFWYSVMTTGVYCRPSCPSRSANPENVQLHDTVEEARATGFRPCKRFLPDGLSVDAENIDIVAGASLLIEPSEESPAFIYIAVDLCRSPCY